MSARPQTDRGHRPVLLQEVLEALAPRDGAIYVDGTFGAGGYSCAILEAADCTVWGIDRDAKAVARGRELAAGYPNRLHLVEGCFGDMSRLLADKVDEPLDGVALDLGVSSMQLDEPERGFSFRADGPLDMRMEGPSAAARPSAAEAVNSLPEQDLADIIYTYGEERRARQVARAIVAARSEKPFTRTAELAKLVRGVVKPARSAKGAKAIDPATRTFQALRIYVNDELGEHCCGLAQAESVRRCAAAGLPFIWGTRCNRCCVGAARSCRCAESHACAFEIDNTNDDRRRLKSARRGMLKGRI